MKLLLCIPAYNEEHVIVPTVETVARVLMDIPDISWHIVVADNASSDQTAAKVRSLGRPDVSVLSIPGKGKGRAIRAAVQYADADVFGFIDADLSAHPNNIKDLLKAIESEADIAIGSRLLNPRAVTRGYLRTLSSKLFNVARKQLLGIRVADSQCGLKVMNRRGIKVLKMCREDTWFLDVELLARMQQRGLRIAELPISWDENHYEGRVSKLSVVRDGFGALQAFFRIRRNIRVS